MFANPDCQNRQCRNGQCRNRACRNGKYLNREADAKAWYRLPEEYQLELADRSLRRAVVLIAEQAEQLALAMEAGDLIDRGGPDALRILGRLMRMTGREHLAPAGHA